MKPRIDVSRVAPEAREALKQLQSYVDGTGLPRSILELVKIRASQLNGCASCLALHSKDARALGEKEERIYLLNAWREAPFYTDRERAALAWTEAVTLIANNHISDDLYNQVRKHFTEKELVELTMAIITINGWNRLNISMGKRD